MRKTSRLSSKITESCRWWDCSMAEIAEWTFEGGSETGQNRLEKVKRNHITFTGWDREYGATETATVIWQRICMYVKKRAIANLSGTAD